LRLNVKCRSPSYARGEYTFDSLQELLKWFQSVRSVSKRDRSNFIFAIAKDGELNLSKYGLSIDIKFDSSDYFLANRLAEETGLLRRETIRLNSEILIEFVKKFDTAKR